MVLALTLAACGERAPAAPAVTPADVMFAQMSLAHIAQGTVVTGLIAAKTRNPELTAIARELDARWTADRVTLTGWLTAWHRPLAPDPDPSAHAGHGDLHTLRPADVRELRERTGADFDRSAGAVLTGLLNTFVETSRSAAGTGRYPPAISLAATMTTEHQRQVRRLLDLAAVS